MEFEDCWRRAVMLGEIGPGDKLQHLLFDMDDIRWSSRERKETMRRIVLGI
jgi:hypothetical protein